MLSKEEYEQLIGELDTEYEKFNASRGYDRYFDGYCNAISFAADIIGKFKEVDNVTIKSK